MFIRQRHLDSANMTWYNIADGWLCEKDRENVNVIVLEALANEQLSRQVDKLPVHLQPFSQVSTLIPTLVGEFNEESTETDNNEAIDRNPILQIPKQHTYRVSKTSTIPRDSHPVDDWPAVSSSAAARFQSTTSFSADIDSDVESDHLPPNIITLQENLDLVLAKVRDLEKSLVIQQKQFKRFCNLQQCSGGKSHSTTEEIDSIRSQLFPETANVSGETSDACTQAKEVANELLTLQKPESMEANVLQSPITEIPDDIKSIRARKYGSRGNTPATVNIANDNPATREN